MISLMILFEKFVHFVTTYGYRCVRRETAGGNDDL